MHLSDSFHIAYMLYHHGQNDDTMLFPDLSTHVSLYINCSKTQLVFNRPFIYLNLAQPYNNIVTTPFLLLLSYLFRRQTFTFVYFFQWTILLHCSFFWLNNRTMHLHCSLLLIDQRLDRTIIYHCSLILNFHCLNKYINSSSLQLVLQLVFNKDLYQLNKLKTIPLATKALFCLEQTWSQNDWLRSWLQIAWIFRSRNKYLRIKPKALFWVKQNWNSLNLTV